MTLSPLRVNNEEFLVSSLIERCPKSMMLRELVKNGLESAALADHGDKRVEIGFVKIGEVRKLSVWNTGLGMNAEELYRMCDIASSIGKQNALNENFGMGAKVASLPSNHLGVRYRSCKSGTVHQVVMGKRDGVYGRVKQAGPDGALTYVIDVTGEAGASGHSLDKDWTEVVLMGNRPEQDTLANPYDDNPSVATNWISLELMKRFFRLPPDVALIMRAGTHRGGGDRRFVAIGDRLDTFARHEAVRAADDIVIHYFYDAADPKDPRRLASWDSAVEPLFGMASIVSDNEMYDLREFGFWIREAPVFGISFGSRHISVYVELMSGYPLVPDAYRQFLRKAGNLQSQMATKDFAPAAMANRPAWLVDLLKSLAPASQHISGLRDELQLLFQSLGVRRRWWPKTASAPTPKTAAAKPAADITSTVLKAETHKAAEIAAPKAAETEAPKAADTPVPKAAMTETPKVAETVTPKAEQKEARTGSPAGTESMTHGPGGEAPEHEAEEIHYEAAPEIIPLSDPMDVHMRGLKDNAARFYPETHQLFVNTSYSSFNALKTSLEAEFSAVDDPESMRSAVQAAVEQTLIRQICRKLAFGLAKRDIWQAWQVDSALSSFSLTLAADDQSENINTARKAVMTKLASKPDA